MAGEVTRHCGRAALSGLAAILVAFFWPSPATAQTDPRAAVERAIGCYARLDYDCVLESMEGLSVGAAADVLPRDLVEEAVRVHAVSLIVRGVPVAARVQFFDLLVVWPSYRLEGEELSPRFFVVFNEALAMHEAQPVAHGIERAARGVGSNRDALARGRSSAAVSAETARERCVEIVAPAAGRRGRPDADLRIALGGGYQQFFGEDRAAFGGAFGFSIRLQTEALAGIHLGLGVDRTLHAVELANLVDENLETLHVLDLVVDVGWPFHLGPARLVPGLGAGVTGFGYDGAFERGGGLVDLFLVVGASLDSGLGTALEVRQRLALVQGDEAIALSSPLTFAIHMTYDFEVD